ncbi:MAG: phosphate acyltransferase PlsX [Planctomycetota bacterium]|nr:MAG: phosphate acyltransferase PlsX [Planctomycetota bacterium]
MSVRVAVDAMGGDYAPAAVVQGAVRAIARFDDLHLTFVGDQRRIRAELERVGLAEDEDRWRIVHASQVVAMDESPIEALKSKPDSSLLRMVELAVAGEVDAVLSAGHTGACAAACQLKLRPLPGVTRPGIAVTIPSFHGPFVLCDVGANIQAKPRHLYEYAVMASIYAERIIGIERPRVALISIGEESGKGTGLIKQAFPLLEADPSLNFVGNAEGRELFEDRCDVAICDGFVGNVILKFVEGLAAGLFQTIAHEFEKEPPPLKERIVAALDRIGQRHDYRRYGGAPLLGINGVCIICHGRSNEVAVENAVGVARRFVLQSISDAIAARFR